jgi:hypothetical protein
VSPIGISNGSAVSLYAIVNPLPTHSAAETRRHQTIVLCIQSDQNSPTHALKELRVDIKIYSALYICTLHFKKADNILLFFPCDGIIAVLSNAFTSFVIKSSSYDVHTAKTGDFLSQQMAKRMNGGCGLYLKRLNLKQREHNTENVAIISVFVPIVKVLLLWRN